MKHWASKMLEKRLRYFKYGSRVPKFLRLPTPKELGKSNSNALQSSMFGSSSPGAYTWEDYWNDMERLYPIKYFIEKTLSNWIRRNVFGPIKNFWYYIKSHTFKRHHVLDLRNYEYQFGWVDADNQLLYATMAILENFIIEHDTVNRLKETIEANKHTSDQFEIIGNDRQIELCKELLAIQTWWRHERPLNIKKFDDDCCGDGGLLRKEDTKIIQRIAEIRGNLWT